MTSPGRPADAPAPPPTAAPAGPPGPPAPIPPVPAPRRPPAAQAPPPQGKNKATAHLCAAAYLDREFRDGVIDEVYSRADRAIAPNQGTDAVPVLRHVLRARSLDVAQQAILASLFLILLCTGIAPIFWLLIGLLLWGLLGSPIRWFAAGFATTPIRRRRERSRRTKMLIWSGAVVAVLWFWFYLLPSLMMWLYFSGVIRYGTDIAAAPERDQGSWFAPVLIMLLLLGCVTAVFGVLRAVCLTAIPTEPEPMAPSDRRAAFIGAAQRAPVVNYHAAGSPFVGSGYELATWRFAMTLRPAGAGAEERAAMRIDVVDLNRHVRKRILELGDDSGFTMRLPNLTLTDQVHVSGRDTVQPTHYLGDLPRSGYRFNSIEQIQRDPTTPARHFLRCEVVSWDGELVTTVYLHLALQGQSLYAEFSSCALPPTPERYHVFGHGSVPKGLTVLLGLLSGAASMPIDFARSPLDTARNIARAFRNASQERGSWRGASEDHGAVASIRELGTDVAEQNHFQYRDAMKYLHILERQILEAMLEYLRDNGADLGELEERAKTIVNNGIVNYGKLTVGAAGAGATATVGAVGDSSRGTATGGKP